MAKVRRVRLVGREESKAKSRGKKNPAAPNEAIQERRPMAINRKGPKPRNVNYELIPLQIKEPYELLDTALEFHDELRGVRIALAWRKRQKTDRDGHLTLGKCMKVSDLNKEFAQFDFIIVLNREVWNDSEFGREKKLALIDHELCHAMPLVDDEGEQKVDERGRQLWRSRKHDIEEFREIVQRHGCYKRDLEEFAKALEEKRKEPLFAAKEA